jgi:serine/threonine protein kinase
MINDRYKLMKRIGSGAFGLLFSAKNVNTDEIVAVKLEPTAQPDTLTHEAAVLQHLSNIPGIPTLRYYGIPDHNRYMVIDLYDKTLQTVSYNYKKAVPVALVRAYALQMMQILSAVHEKGFVHRDIKPENFMIKCDTDTLYLIDFGLARTYIDSETKMHRANRIRAANADGKISVSGSGITVNEANLSGIPETDPHGLHVVCCDCRVDSLTERGDLDAITKGIAIVCQAIPINALVRAQRMDPILNAGLMYKAIELVDNGQILPVVEPQIHPQRAVIPIRCAHTV